MPTKYLILRTNKPVGDSFAFSSPAAWSASGGGPTDLAIQTIDGHEADGGQLRADPLNAVVMDAEVMLKLIEPTPNATTGDQNLQQVGSLRMPIGLIAVGAHTSPFTGQGVTIVSATLTQTFGSRALESTMPIASA